MRKRLLAQIAARRKQGIPADVEGMDADLRAMLDTQVGDLERRIESVIAQEETAAEKARLLRSIPGIGPVSAAMLIAEMPELGRMTSGEAAAMTGLAPVPHDSGAMRGRRAIAGGRRSLRHVLFRPHLPPLSQSSSEAGRAAPQNARQAAQTRHCRYRPQAGHHCKRDLESGCLMATKPGHVNTVASGTGAQGGRQDRACRCRSDDAGDHRGIRVISPSRSFILRCGAMPRPRTEGRPNHLSLDVIQTPISVTESPRNMARVRGSEKRNQAQIMVTGGDR